MAFLKIVVRLSPEMSAAFLWLTQACHFVECFGFGDHFEIFSRSPPWDAFSFPKNFTILGLQPSLEPLS
jgi:hypothetical protein